ncbi:MAG: tetratricopeptide repeat protein, partial [Actinomycetota bacterium]|nr:tetratricopeptide repeat protein [Actinomycetota bacterium]
RWAHRVRGEFPDGQLYVNLRGYDPDQPFSAGYALAGFLRALGVAGVDIPPEVDERAAAYRSLLDGRRILVVLDNASSVEQVRPLLPGTPSALVVVTSRDALAGLVARDGARRLELDLLPPEDAVVLLGALIGGRVTAEPDAAAELAGQCARLPLALRVAAELTAARPATPLAALVGELADQQRRLALLDAGGDPRTAVRTVFSWSYQHLPVEAARAFRMLGLHPGPDFDLYAAAALTHTDLEQAQHLLALLARAHLIRPTGPGRYGMHDLLRAYATNLATHVDTGGDSEEARWAALTRLFDHYLAAAAAAMDTLHPAEQDRRPRVPPSATPTPPVPDRPAARAWLDAERATLTAVCAHAAARGWPRHTTGLASTLSRYLEVGAHYLDAVAIHTDELRAARDVDDPAGEVHALINLGSVYWRQGRYGQAAEHHQQALTLSRELGHRAGEARALDNLGLVNQRQGRYQQAAEHHQQALALFRGLGHRADEAYALINLGLVYQRQGRYQQAAERHQQALTLAREIDDGAGEADALDNLGTVYQRQGYYQHATEHHQQALSLFREIGHRAGEARALGNLGLVYRRQGRYQQATEHHQQALTLAREIGHRAGEATALGDLGAVHWRQGRYQQAAEHHQQALTLFREIGHRTGEAMALNGVGETHHATGHPEQARAHHTAALTLATQTGNRYELARAHNGLAHTHHAIGDPHQARHHWHQALALYTDLDVPEAGDVHAQLTALDQATGDDNGD